MQASLDFNKNVAPFRYKENVNRIKLVREGQEKASEIDGELTTNESGSEKSFEKGIQEEFSDDKRRDRELVSVLNESQLNEDQDWDLKQAFTHLDSRTPNV